MKQYTSRIIAETETPSVYLNNVADECKTKELGYEEIKELIFKTFSEFNLMLQVPSFTSMLDVFKKQNPDINVQVSEIKKVFNEITGEAV